MASRNRLKINILAIYTYIAYTHTHIYARTNIATLEKYLYLAVFRRFKALSRSVWYIQPSEK